MSGLGRDKLRPWISESRASLPLKLWYYDKERFSWMACHGNAVIRELSSWLMRNRNSLTVGHHFIEIVKKKNVEKIIAKGKLKEETFIEKKRREGKEKRSIMPQFGSKCDPLLNA